MKRFPTIVLVVALAGAGACGDDDGSPTSEPGPATTSTTEAVSTTGEAPTTTAAAAPAPGDLGEEIGRLYLAAYDDVIEELADRPDPDDAAAGLTALKEQYIEELVALGWEREALDDAGRAAVDAQINITLGGLTTETFDEYAAALDHYADDPELADLIRSFNIIGQYANFDLLREQEPEEAERLGLDG